MEPEYALKMARKVSGIDYNCLSGCMALVYTILSYNIYSILPCRKLETLDTMSQKIVVKATDDVYKTTKEKLAVKNEESMKSRYVSLYNYSNGVYINNSLSFIDIHVALDLKHQATVG